MREKILSEEVDGEALIMLTRKDITDILGLKLGPALKVSRVSRFTNYVTRVFTSSAETCHKNS